MEIDYRSDNSLVIKDDTKELSFIDLAKIKGYKLEGNPNHHWVLYQCKELIKEKKIEFGLGTTYYCPSGKLAELYFGYFLNNMNRRTLELNEDGTVRKDFIIIFSPRHYYSSNYYYATVPQSIQFEDYLSEDKKYYESYNKLERIGNNVLADQFIEEYLCCSKRYCNLLNYYSDNYEVLKTIIQRFDDEWYLEYLERNINNNGFTKKLGK